MTFEITDPTSTTDALNQIGLLIDASCDLGLPEGSRRGIELATLLLERSPASNEAPILNYFIANAWSHLRVLSRQGTDADWDWEQPEFEKELIHLRRAISDDGFQKIDDIRQCQILTNFGNVLSYVGRFVEAIEYWGRALRIDPHFPMALANRGYGLISYSRALYDEGHQPVFLRQAHIDLTSGIEKGVDHHAKRVFEAYKTQIENYLDQGYLRDGIDMDGYSLGECEQEQQYRKWCLEKRLFLNPLNDLGPFSIAAHDCFTVPSIVVGLGEGPAYQAFFNQMKQEYVSARYFLFEAITSSETHYSDRGVLLFNMPDYPSYSLAVEKMKIAFKTAYSLLDKIAFFLNDYLALGVPDRQVSFRTIWYKKLKREKGLKDDFERYENWPLRGLFGLSKDLFEDKPGFQEAIEPDARELNEIRNHAEHKYLKVHDMYSPELAASNLDSGQGDRLAYSVGRFDFEAKALRMLKHVRAALIYLSLGIHCEEGRRRADRGDKYVGPAFLDIFDDDWKV